MKSGIHKEDQLTITANGMTKTVKEWADKNNIRQTSIHTMRRKKLAGEYDRTWEQIVGEEYLFGRKKSRKVVSAKKHEQLMSKFTRRCLA